MGGGGGGGGGYQNDMQNTQLKFTVNEKDS